MLHLLTKLREQFAYSSSGLNPTWHIVYAKLSDILSWPDNNTIALHFVYLNIWDKLHASLFSNKTKHCRNLRLDCYIRVLERHWELSFCTLTQGFYCFSICLHSLCCVAGWEAVSSWAIVVCMGGLREAWLGHTLTLCGQRLWATAWAEKREKNEWKKKINGFN